jgi:hypothetical protein
MEGAARAAKRKSDREVEVAYYTGAFTGAASAGKLKALDHYIKKPKRAQTPAEMLAVFREFAARGTPMNIRQVN